MTADSREGKCLRRSKTAQSQGFEEQLGPGPHLVGPPGGTATQTVWGGNQKQGRVAQHSNRYFLRLPTVTQVQGRTLWWGQGRLPLTVSRFCLFSQIPECVPNSATDLADTKDSKKQNVGQFMLNRHLVQQKVIFKCVLPSLAIWVNPSQVHGILQLDNKLMPFWNKHLCTWIERDLEHWNHIVFPANFSSLNKHLSCLDDFKREKH